MHKLETVASQNGFTLHDVPADGNCMFSAIVYQLNSIGIHVDSHTLRQNVVEYLQANKASYCDFVCQPVETNDGYNADTVAPTKEDMYIASIADPHLQTELRWQKYLTQLEDGAWGDNIAMQAISEVLSVNITVLTSHYPAYSVTPQKVCELFVGLIMQFHYVRLDRVGEPALPIADKPDLPKQPDSNSDNELDNATISFDDKSNWLKCNPVTAARHFQYRLNALFLGFLKSTAKPLGEITDYAIRIKFQARGSPHAHCVIWVKDAPKYMESPDSDVCDFIDQYVLCALPTEDGKLRELVLLLQQHKHSLYCKRNKTCHFDFLKPPSPKTLITEFDPENTDVQYSKTVLKKVQKLLAESSTDVSLADLLYKADLTEKEYVEALQTSCTGNVVVLKCETNECCINKYNPAVMLAWQANIDILFVLNAYACVMYVASYIMKTERSMGELLKRVATEPRTAEKSWFSISDTQRSKCTRSCV